MFVNYSQTYASAITTLAGMAVSLGAVYGYTFLPVELEFLLGVLVNVGGIVWTIVHRYNKGGVSIMGVKQ